MIRRVGQIGEPILIKLYHSGFDQSKHMVRWRSTVETMKKQVMEAFLKLSSSRKGKIEGEGSRLTFHGAGVSETISIASSFRASL